MPTRWVGQGGTLECCYKLLSLDMRETLPSLSTRISSFPKVFFFPSQFFSPRCVFCRAGLASSPVCTHCLAPFSWHLGEASRQYHNTVINSNYCFLQTFSTFNLEGGCCIRALWISVSRYSSKALCNTSCLVTCLAQNVYLTSHLWVRRVLVSVIACGLCYCFVGFLCLCVCTRVVFLVLTMEITQLEIGQLYQSSISVISSEQRFWYRAVPTIMIFLRLMGLSYFNPLLLC